MGIIFEMPEPRFSEIGPETKRVEAEAIALLKSAQAYGERGKLDYMEEELFRCGTKTGVLGHWFPIDYIHNAIVAVRNEAYQRALVRYDPNKLLVLYRSLQDEMRPSMQDDSRLLDRELHGRYTERFS